jgi:hypothetical protein
MWSTHRVSAVAASLIAVAGTLLGSASTYWFQQKAARRSETVARQERVRQDQLAACSEFAATISDLRRSVIEVRFRKNRKDRQAASDEYHIAYAEADRLGAVAESAKFRMLFVIDDPTLRELADAAFRHVGAVLPARDKAEVEKLDAGFAAHMDVFVATAARLLSRD